MKIRSGFSPAPKQSAYSVSANLCARDMRTSMSARFIMVVAACLSLVSAANAHHSFLGRFDRQSITEIEGEIRDLVWRNPHGYMTLRVEAPNGGTTDWELETSSVSLMARLGVTRDLLPIGSRIRIAGYPPVGTKPEMYVRHILLEDGRELLLDINLTPRWTDRTVGTGSQLAVREGSGSRPELGIFRVWMLIRDGERLFPEVVDPTFNVESYPMTSWAHEQWAGFDLATENPTNNCQPKGMPTIMEQPYPIAFEQLDDGNIALRIEEYDLERIIHMDPDADAAARRQLSLLGYSTGAWSNGTLQVTTTRISWPYFSQLGIPQTEDARIFERFTPSADGSRLDYTMTVTDPAVFTEPVTLGIYWIWVPEIELLSYDCAIR
jgi:hypothetical protein